MDYAIAALVVGLASAAVGLLTAAIHRRIGLDLRRHHHEVGSVVFLQLGVVFAVLLAFVCDECLSEYNAASRAIDLECGALHGAAILAATLPPAAARPVLQSEAAYVVAVLKADWPELRARRRGSEAARIKLGRMVASAAVLRLSDPAARTIQSQILSLFADAHAQRETRMFEAQNGIPIVLWAVLIGLTTLLSAFVAFSGIQYCWTAVIVAMVFTGGTVSILVTARLLNYPFEGAMALSSADFRETLENIQVLLPA